MFGYKHRYFFIFLLASYSFINVLFTEGHKILNYEVKWYAYASVIFIMVAAVWESNHLLEKILQKKSGRTKSKIHPLVILFLSSLLIVFLIGSVVAFISSGLVPEASSSWTVVYKLCLGFGFRINLFLHCVNAIIFFNNKLKKTQLEAETLKKKTVEARFEALRSQVNPHFLFNSLNVLSTLVYKDADTSAKFIDQLSKVYRYLLYYQEKRIVTLEEEMEFLEAYVYLLNIRFSENLFIKIDIKKDKMGEYVAPASLQLLIENAIKHNIVSSKNPLIIQIYTYRDKLIVENNLQEKKVKEPSTSIGLLNISKRYEFISNEPVEIEKLPEKFIVRIPLIQLKEL